MRTLLIQTQLTHWHSWVIVAQIMKRTPLICSILLVFNLACNRTAPVASNSPGNTPVPVLANATFTPVPPPTITPLPSSTPLPEALIKTGDQALLNGDWEKALYEYQLVQTNSSDPKLQAAALLGSARANFMARNDYETLSLLEKLITGYPDAPQAAGAHFLMAQSLSRQERYSEAAQAYLNYLALRPGQIDAYVLDLRGDALFVAGDYSGAKNDYQAALGAASLLDEIQLRLKLARAYAISGDAPTALALYDDLYNRTQNDYTRALIDLRKGQAYTALGQTEQAKNAYLDAVTNFPTSYDSYSALVALVDSGVEVDELQRGIIDYYAGQYGPALTALDHYLQNNPANPASAQYFYGLTSSAQGNYEEAVKRWDIVIQNYKEHPRWDDAWEQKAYTQWVYLDQYTEAVKTLTYFVEKYPGHVRAAEFLNEAGLVAERGGQLNQAIQLWEQLANTYPNFEAASRALFLAGITYYRLKNYPAAEKSFQRYLAVAVPMGEKSAAQFWIGKALDAAGKAENAQAAWQTAAGIDPTGYYSERARDMLHGRQAFDPPTEFDLAFDRQAEKAKAEEWVRTTFNLPPETDLSSPGALMNDTYFKRGLELWNLGLYDEARAEFESLRILSQNDPAQSYRLMNTLLDLGAYRPAIMSARQVLELAGMDDTTSLSAPAYFNHIRFGTYYSDLVMPLAENYGFHSLFLYALIRQESLFEGFVNSSAGARGLMQIMPATGTEIAGNLGWPENYTEDDLFRPLVSLRYGVDYLDRQRKLFDGNLYAALAAYNGGPGNAQEWLELALDDPDLFLEVIRYDETRNYLRRIYENFNIYRLIYNRTP
jgi:soluble lytic murein transglycosylase